MNVLRRALQKSKKDDFHDNEKLGATSLEYSIEQYLEKEKVELDDISREISTHVTDVFLALGNYDVRFDFDPFSIDDCRCDIVSSREVDVLCSLKHVPLRALVIEEGGIPGRLKLKVKEDFVGTVDEVSWEDFTDASSDTRYLNSTKIYKSLSKAIQHAVDDVGMVNASVEIKFFNTMISLWFHLSENDHVYKVNLFPSIQVNNSCENFQFLLKIFSSEFPGTFVDECCIEQGIHFVAKFSADTNSAENEWSLNLNDVEKRVILSEKFECAKDCLTLLNEFNFTLHEDTSLSNYQLQTIVLGEIFTKPSSKEWKRKLLQKRMLRILESLEACLRTGRCVNMFTGVNLFADMNQATRDLMVESVRGYRNHGN